MSEDKGRGPLLPISGLAIFLAALGLSVFNPTPFKGLRPSVNELREPFEKVSARLWQDPFRAVLDYVKSDDPKQPAKGAGQFGLLDKGQDRMGGNDSLLAQITEKRKKYKVTVLGVMVFGGPFAEAAETRIRQRYAALSGLRRLGFVPGDPEHIDYIRVATHENQEPGAPSLSTIMPFEWLTNTTNARKDSVLLLWLNVDLLMKEPLPRLARLVDCLEDLGRLKDMTFKIIGPPGSTALQVMLEGTNKADPVFDTPGKVEIYSGMASVDERLLLDSIGENTKRMSEECARHKIEGRFKKHGITFERTILSDGDLAKVLIEELSLRQVNLGLKKNHVVLVAEWDTDYGRSLPEIFNRVLIEERVPEKEIANRVHRVSYLRGIDGSLPGEKEEKKEDQPDTKAKPEDKIKKLEQPTGKSQYDYLRRMAEETYLLDQNLREDEGGIRAIGVLGSDFYDKHLVLQAFRQRFPQAIFITTDLDAWLLHPNNIEWTRNLVVASSFDLSLRKDKEIDIQGDIPPFRDSYQTSLFFAILRAFLRDDYLTKEETVVVKQPLQPLIFEIGWNRAYNLTDLRGGGVQPNRDESQKAKILFPKILAIATALILLLFFTSATVFRIMRGALFSGWRWRIITTAALIASLLFLYYFYGKILSSTFEEPFSFFDGISAWPAELLRTLAFFLSLFFIITSDRALRKNKVQIFTEFGFRMPSGTDGPKPRIANDSVEGTTTLPDNSNIIIAKRMWKRLINSCDYDWEVEGRKEMDELWNEYVRRDSWWYRIARLFPIIIFYIALCWLIVGDPVTPMRGPYSFTFNKWILALSVVSFVFLIFYVFDVTRTCRQLIINATKDSPFWSPDSLKKFASSFHHEAESPLSEWMLIHLIARRTDVVGKLIFYPFIVWFIMFIARFYYFDNWHAPIGLIIVLSLSAGYAWSCAFFLRRSAEGLRKTSIHRLKEKLVRVLTESGPDEGCVKQIDFALKEVGAIDEGAFAPFSQHPVVQALIVPFGGVGGMYLIDFLAKLNV